MVPPPCQCPKGVIQHYLHIRPAYVFVEHQVVDPYLDSLPNPSLKLLRLNLQDLSIVQTYAVVRLATVYMFGGF